MARRAKHGSDDCSRTARGFTLVEILTAMALAVLVMLGVVQVFKMTTDAVSAAERKGSGYQAARGAMNTIAHDLTRFSHDYLALYGHDIELPSKTSRNQKTKYRFDGLAFAVTGLCREMESASSTTAKVGGGAEVFYGAANRKEGAGGATGVCEMIADGDSDPRTILLVRKVFPMWTTPTSWGGYGSSGLKIADAPSKATMGCLSLMAMDRWNDGTPKYRLSPPPQITTNSAPSQPQVNVEPSYNGEEFPSYDSTVNLVVCDRISEFVVEIWAENWRKEMVWARPSSSSRSFKQAVWCGYYKSPLTQVQMTSACRGIGNGSRSVPAENIKSLTMPSMVRVTMVVHPYGDNKPLRQQPYVGDVSKDYYQKYRGMVFRRVFSLNGSVNRFKWAND